MWVLRLSQLRTTAERNEKKKKRRTKVVAQQAGPLTTVQAQLIVERVELVLDVLRTGAVLAGAEVQKDIDLGKKRTETGENS